MTTTFFKELEYAKCWLADLGFDIVHLDRNCFRAIKQKLFYYDVWVSYKKGFKGYTIKRWRSGKYYKGVKSIEMINTLE